MCDRRIIFVAEHSYRGPTLFGILLWWLLAWNMCDRIFFISDLSLSSKTNGIISSSPHFFSLEWAYCPPNGKNAVRKCHPMLKISGLHLLLLWYVTEMWHKCTLPEYSFLFVMAMFSLSHFFNEKVKSYYRHER